MYKLTKVAVDSGKLIALPDHTEGHELVNFECGFLAQPLLLAVAAPADNLPWKQHLEWCSDLRVGGFTDWASIHPVPAFALCNRRRTEWPLVDPLYLPNHAGKLIWTSAEDLTPPAGYAFVVSLDDGYAYIYAQRYLYGALACRPGRSFSPETGVTP